MLIGDTVETFAPDDAFSLMVQDVSAAIRGESAEVFPASSSLRVAEILDSIRTSEKNFLFQLPIVESCALRIKLGLTVVLWKGTCHATS